MLCLVKTCSSQDIRYEQGNINKEIKNEKTRLLSEDVSNYVTDKIRPFQSLRNKISINSKPFWQRFLQILRLRSDKFLANAFKVS